MSQQCNTRPTNEFTASEGLDLLVRSPWYGVRAAMPLGWSPPGAAASSVPARRSNGADGRAAAAPGRRGGRSVAAGSPISRPLSRGDELPCDIASPFIQLLHAHCSNTASRPFSLSLAANRIAPVTHRDLAERGVATSALAAWAAPEKRWCQAVSSCVEHRRHGSRLRVPAPGWLAAWAIQ